MKKKIVWVGDEETCSVDNLTSNLAERLVLNSWELPPAGQLQLWGDRYTLKELGFCLSWQETGRGQNIPLHPLSLLTEFLSVHPHNLLPPPVLITGSVKDSHAPGISCGDFSFAVNGYFLRQFWKEELPVIECHLLNRWHIHQNCVEKCRNWSRELYLSLHLAVFGPQGLF